MDILFVASEVDPFAKTGGLADVAAALPKALSKMGHDVRIVMPLYRQVDRRRFGLKPAGMSQQVVLGSQTFTGRIDTAMLPKSSVTTYFIACDPLFDREGLYQTGGKDHADNLTRFSFFSQAALGMLPKLDFKPQILHCHDWQAALALALLRHGRFSEETFYSRMRGIFTIHNLAYQGLFPKEQWPLTQLPEGLFTMEGLEFYGQINCLKAGLIHADLLTTVSPTYAQEIQTKEFGCGLEGLLNARRDQLVGILNGIDQEEWDPASDPHLETHYSVDKLAGKSLCKLALQRSQKLPERHDLLIGMIQRLAEQKGIDILLESLETLLALPLQLVILGSGDAVYQQRLTEFAKRFPKRIAVNLRFDNALAHQIEAGADAFLMPSRFEPCGLNQLYSMRYGTIPIVKRVGGLADTVQDTTASSIAGKTATGFVFEAHTTQALTEAVRRALTVFHDQKLWTQLVQTSMQQDFSWNQSARAYLQVYERALSTTASLAFNDPNRHP